MSNPRTKGRMLNKDISCSHKFASLSPASAVLFCMIIPHLNSHGKINGGPGYIKDEICPYISYLTIENIPKHLNEISSKTNIKWFKNDGRLWIHSINFLSDHQTLDPKKLGSDLLPSYSEVSQDSLQSKDGVGLGLVGHEVEVEVEVEVEEEVEDKCASGDARMIDFEEFWNVFNLKKGRGGAEHSWKKIKGYSKELKAIIIAAAEIEAVNRPKLIAGGGKPKWAQGWITERRWEDESEDASYIPVSTSPTNNLLDYAIRSTLHNKTKSKDFNYENQYHEGDGYVDGVPADIAKEAEEALARRMGWTGGH